MRDTIFLFEILLCSFPSYLKKSLRRGMWMLGCYLETLSSSWVSNQKYLSVPEGLMEQQNSGDQSSELLSLQLSWQTLEHTKCALSSLPSAQLGSLVGAARESWECPWKNFREIPGVQAHAAGKTSQITPQEWPMDMDWVRGPSLHRVNPKK